MPRLSFRPTKLSCNKAPLQLHLHRPHRASKATRPTGARLARHGEAGARSPLAKARPCFCQALRASRAQRQSALEPANTVRGRVRR